MPNPVIEALRAALEAKKLEMSKLEAAIRMFETEESVQDVPRPRRFRRSTGFKPDSVPSHIYSILSQSKLPMSAVDLSEALSARGKNVEARMIAASISRYVGRVFRRDEEGKYLLLI